MEFEALKRRVVALERSMVPFNPDGEQETFGASNGTISTSRAVHVVSGSVKLSNGRASVSIRSDIADGKADVSFRAKNTYSGYAYPVDTSITERYSIIPVDGTTFIVQSSLSSDTATVQYVLRGE